jgi:hypothetical protein
MVTWRDRPEDLKKDVYILRELGKQYAEIASDPRHTKNMENWKKHNSLKPVKPMVYIDKIPWHELSIHDELTLRCNHPYLKGIEWQIRETLYRWKRFPCDMVVLPYIQVSKVVRQTDIGIAPITQDNGYAQTHLYVDQIRNDEELSRIRNVHVEYEEEETNRRLELLGNIFEGILPVRLTGHQLLMNIWDKISQLRGVEPCLYDFIERPDFLHRIMSRFVDIAMDLVDQYESLNLFDDRLPLCHCSYTFTDELKGEDYDPNRIKAKNMWVAGMAQLFSCCSPEMLYEFDIKHVKRVYDRFGFVYYGCCEPLHRCIGYIKNIDNVRKISVSPWADVHIAAENMGKDYIMARKPNPAFLAEDTLAEDAIRQEIRETLDACAKNNTPTEFILKDITTVRNDPCRLTRWYEIVKSEIE